MKGLTPKKEEPETLQEPEDKIPYRPEQDYSQEDYANESFYPRLT